MKTITLKSKAALIRSQRILVLVSFLTCGASFAQLQNNGILFVGDNGILTLKTGTYGFGSNAGTLSKTTRTNSSYGKIVFGAAATSTGATSNHFLDGYGRTLSDQPFIMNIGQGTVLAPIRIDAADATLTGVDAAFYNIGQTKGTTIDAELSEISNSEYWDIQGTNATISLSWRTATLANLSTSNYTIVGFNSGTNTWDIIPSIIDQTSFLGGLSTPTAGSIKSTSDVNLILYRYLTIGAKGDACQPIVDANTIVKTWSGTWSGDNLPPNEFNAVILTASYNTELHGGSFSCNSLVLNEGVTLTITDEKSIECVKGVTGSGKIILSSTANFVQRDNGALAPKIELTKRTRKMRRYDYIYWGTPISGDFKSQIANARIVAENSETVPNAGAFDLLYKYNSGLAVGQSGWAPLDVTTSGRGFISRVKLQAPLIDLSVYRNIDMKFDGIANNGEIEVLIKNNPASPNAGNSHNLLANPYPSAIDGDKFLIENTNLDGVIYLWKQKENYTGSGFYHQEDYVAYTRLGSSTLISPVLGVGGTTPQILSNASRIIASGQGFKVKSLVNSGQATFNNCMRVLEGNSTFVRSANAVVDSYKVTMSGPNGVSSTILVGYTPETTLSYDRMYDATTNSVSTAQVFTVLDNTDIKLAINARPSFENTDTVKMGMLKNNTYSETFVFNIDEKEGIFNTPDVNVYIHDKVQNTYHNLNNGSFSFTTSAANVLNRFELVYQTDSTLSNPGFVTAQTFVTLNDNVFKVNSSKEISNIAIYDIAGRLISTYAGVNNVAFSTAFNRFEGVYIAKIILTDGTIVTEKLINKQ